jgi:hypothetical protein
MSDRIAADLANHASRRFGAIAQEALSLLDEEGDREHFLVLIGIQLMMSLSETMLGDHEALANLSARARTILVLGIIKSKINESLTTQEKSDLAVVMHGLRTTTTPT